MYRQVIDAVASVIAVTNFARASQGIAATTLRAVIGDIVLDDVLARREQINEDLRRKLDEVTERWGVKVTTVEIREVLPPREVQEAMNRQMSAERTRRAAVTEANGRRRSPSPKVKSKRRSCVRRASARARSSKLRATPKPFRPSFRRRHRWTPRR